LQGLFISDEASVFNSLSLSKKSRRIQIKWYAILNVHIYSN